ncbi:isochorismate synthase [Opitutales bacterium]|nr:isochorismate synthase [Opitutales bacterium]
MNNSSFCLTPMVCDQNTNLYPFFEDCLSKAKIQNATFYSSITFETNYSDPLAVIEQIHESNQSICYFEKQSDEFSIACGDPIAEARFSGAERFQQAKVWSQKLLSDTLVAGDHKVEGSGPTLFLNATFEESSSDSKYPALQVFLPHWQVVRKGGAHFIVINCVISPETKVHELNVNVSKTLERFDGLHDQRPSGKNQKKIQLGKPIEENFYEHAVSKALKLISKGIISKIVLARKLIYQTEKQLPYFSIAHSLRNKFPDCYTFCMSTPDNGMFIGATPEILTRISGNSLETEAVAGTAARGPSAGKDAHLGKTLLGRKKEVREHRLVIDSMIRRLKSCGISECKEGRTRLLRLSNLQHVRTPLQATLPEGVHPFDAISALHPTPAMGGSPREKALPIVQELEGFSRGWYSGVAGWFDSRGRGEFMVPIRCGKIMPKSLTLFAGAGIVEGSIPANEKVETDLKLEAMLEVITGKSTLPHE